MWKPCISLPVCSSFQYWSQINGLVIKGINAFTHTHTHTHTHKRGFNGSQSLKSILCVCAYGLFYFIIFLFIIIRPVIFIYYYTILLFFNLLHSIFPVNDVCMFADFTSLWNVHDGWWWTDLCILCNIASKINGTPKRCLRAHFEATLDFMCP